MVWLHGGGNTVGHGGSYNGASLATTHDVVVVTLNYRLGLFGWFSHPQLATGNPLEDSGNYGTLDAIQALQWVRQNIDRFGGDSSNVTLFGESAGAFDTLALMAAPLAEGLFHKAIVQSGGLNLSSITEAQNFVGDGGHVNSAREIVNQLLVADGTVDNLNAARDYQSDMSKRRLREYLYSKKTAEFFAPLDGRGFGMIDLPMLIADGHVLPELSIEAIFSDPNNHSVVPIILGTNRDEPSTFMVRDPRYTKNLLGILPRLRDPETYQKAVRYGALAWKERGVDSLANYMTEAGNPNVFAYRFDWDEEPSQMGFDLSIALGAGHGLEIPFVFNEFDNSLGAAFIYPNDQAQMNLALQISSYWAEFAHTSDPGRGRDGGAPQWLKWGQDGKRSIILDTAADQGIFMDDSVVTIDAIKQELSADTFANEIEQCHVYARTFRGEHLNEQEYAALNATCANTSISELLEDS